MLLFNIVENLEEEIQAWKGEMLRWQKESHLVSMNLGGPKLNIETGE